MFRRDKYIDVGRLIDYSPKPNLQLFRPHYRRGKGQLGLYATVDIVGGSELTLDYGVCEKDWMKVRAMMTLSSGKVGEGLGKGVAGDGGEGRKSLQEGEAMEGDRVGLC